jgi:uncharacterized protein (TIGR02391 family)
MGMASMTRSKSVSPAPANLSLAQIRTAIPQLERRIAELEALPVTTITAGSDPSVLALANAIDGTLSRIYGPDTHEYNRLSKAKEVDDNFYFSRPTVQQIREGVERGRKRAIALLTQKIALLKEQLGDDGDSPTDRAIRAYRNLDLHSEIARAASDLYHNGHYANAIEDAVKALSAWVRYRSGETLDGTTLMEKVFSPKNPVLRFNELKDKSDEDEQRGFMMLFTGAITALRNPRAHKLIEDEAERALEFIAFVSLLAKRLDGAKKVP